jgi:hypothetical protein
MALAALQIALNLLLILNLGQLLEHLLAAKALVIIISILLVDNPTLYLDLSIEMLPVKHLNMLIKGFPAVLTLIIDTQQFPEQILAQRHVIRRVDPSRLISHLADLGEVIPLPLKGAVLFAEVLFHHLFVHFGEGLW